MYQLFVVLGQAPRQERAEVVENLEQNYLKSFTTEQLKIIKGLLLKYQENGINELTKADVFNVYPMPGFMYSQKIFGSPQKLRKNVEKLQEKIYAN